MKELITSEEKFLESLRDSFKIRSHYFPTNEKRYPAFIYKDGKAIPLNPNINAEE